MNRRSFLQTGAGLAAVFCAPRLFGATAQNPALTGYPFTLGVASGDPSSDGFVIWTRLAPRPLEGGGMPYLPVQVDWQIADDEAFRDVVQQGTALARPDFAHAVHVEVQGLRPGRWYWYRFKVGTELSPVGRSRTSPAMGAGADRMRFAFASCQHFEEGYFTAYDHLARQDIDWVIHLGDYIYETSVTEKHRVRQHLTPEPTTVADYRNRYALYKSDPALQRAHAVAPWIVTWDDHEVDNNYAGDQSQDVARGLTADQFLPRRAAAYQAYYEHMPLHRTSLPRGADLQLYRRLAFGDLAQVHVLDTRQYRTDQPNGDGRKAPGDAALDPQATMLGRAQREWLFAGLAASPARWNVIAQQVMLARAVFRSAQEAEQCNMDQWPGYEAERRQVIRYLRDQRVANPVVLTGDYHLNWANELTADFDAPGGPPVAAEFVGTSITSGGDGDRLPLLGDRFRAENPFVKYYGRERGYVRCELTPRAWRADYLTLDFVTRPGGTVSKAASFTVEAGRPHLVTS